MRKGGERPGPAGGNEVLLAAAARAVRGVPRLHVPRILLQPHAVVVADDRRAFGAARPVLAIGVAARGGVHAGRVRAGEAVVPVRLLAAAFERLPSLGARARLL